MFRKTAKMLGVLILSVVVSLPALSQEMVQVRGSDTMVNVVQRMAEVYMQNNPGRYIAVTGGGSGTGIAAITNKTVDIANASRDIRQQEIIRARNSGVEPTRVVIGMDCITVVVNGDNNVDRLTVAQLGAIFRGEITNWKDVGGADMPITLYGRQSNSGTFVFFRDVVLKGDYSDRMNRMNGTSQIVEAVRADRTGIGYIGLGHARAARGLRVVRLALREGGEYADPTNPAHIAEGKYPIIRTLNQYIDGMPEGRIKDFLSFEVSPEGQKIMSEMGFVPIPSEYVEYNRTNAGV